MTWLRYRWARTTEALRAATTYNLAEPIVSKDAGFHFGRLFLGNGVAAGGRGVKFADEGDHLVQSVKTADYTVAAADRYQLLVGNAATAIVFTLPALSGLPAGVPYRFFNTGLGPLTLDGNASETIDGAATIVLDTGDSAVLVPNGGSWRAVITRAPDRADPETDVASAATCDIGAAGTARIRITGTTTITSLGSRPRRVRIVRFQGVLTLTHNGTSLALPTGANVQTAAGDVAVFASDASGNWRCESYTRANGQALATASVAVALPPGYLSGLSIVSFSGNSVTFKAGKCRSADDTMDVVLASNLTKNFANVFAAGDTSGGRGVALPATGTLHIFAITRDSDGVVDIYGDTSVTGANKPSGWTVRRRILSLVTDSGSNLRPVVQHGDLFVHDQLAIDINVTNLGTTATLYTLASVPADIEVVASLQINFANNGAANNAVYVNSPLSSAQAIDSQGNRAQAINPGTNLFGKGYEQVLTNSSRQVRAVATAASSFLALVPTGWRDNRGRV